jgi:predicted RNA-binding protein with PIN domain
VPELPDDVKAALLRGVGAYVRTAEQNELPPALKRLRRILRPTGLAKHQTELLGALDLAPTRALILQWLDDAKPPLPKPDAAVLRTAAGAGEAWRGSFPAAAHPEPDRATPDGALEKLQDQLERERARAGKAREAEKAAKDALTRATKEAGAEAAAQAREIAGLREERARSQEELDSHRTAVAKVTDERARERRRAERDLDKERRARQEAERVLKDARRELRTLKAELAAARKQTKTPKGRGEARDGQEAPADPTSEPRRRKRLEAPLGLLDDDPKSLARWLRTERVCLLIDGYNVSKSGGGFAHLSLEDQRKRVIDVASRLARKNDLTPIVVFDGAETPPRLSRRPPGPVLVEYSTGEIADDHLIARLADVPVDNPVVFVTDDRELQRRAAALGATIATTSQLLALAR